MEALTADFVLGALTDADFGSLADYADFMSSSLQDAATEQEELRITLTDMVMASLDFDEAVKGRVDAFVEGLLQARSSALIAAEEAAKAAKEAASASSSSASSSGAAAEVVLPAAGKQLRGRGEDSEEEAAAMKAATLRLFEAQAAEEEDREMRAEYAAKKAAKLAAKAEKAAAMAVGPGAGGLRVADALTQLDTSATGPDTRGLGRRAARNARTGKGGKPAHGGGRAEESDSDSGSDREEDGDGEGAAAPAPIVPSNRVVAYDPLEIKLDNREYAAFLSRQEREHSKAEHEAKAQRVREQQEASRAAKEAQMNARFRPKTQAATK